MNPWQVAISYDLNQPIRKWNHLGTFCAPSSLSAAYDAVRDSETGDVVAKNVHSPFLESDAVIYKFKSGLYVRVH